MQCSIRLTVYAILVHVCGIREFEAEIDVENIIEPPPYPGSYGSYMRCWYTITASGDSRIRFWVDDFGTETFAYRFFMSVSGFIELIKKLKFYARHGCLLSRIPQYLLYFGYSQFAS